MKCPHCQYQSSLENVGDKGYFFYTDISIPRHYTYPPAPDGCRSAVLYGCPNCHFTFITPTKYGDEASYWFSFGIDNWPKPADTDTRSKLTRFKEWLCGWLGIPLNNK